MGARNSGPTPNSGQLGPGAISENTSPLYSNSQWHHGITLNGATVPAMRTTLTIDDDLAEALKEQARRADQPFKQVVNDTLRRGLSAAPNTTEPDYKVKPHQSGFRTGVDPMRLNQLDEPYEAARSPGSYTQ